MINPYFLGGIALISFLSGWTVNDWRHDAKLKAAQDKVRAEEQAKLETLRISLDSSNSERLSLAADLAAEKTKLKIQYKTITQEVPVYAPQNTENCNYDLDPGLVRLLNAAASGSAYNPGRAAGPTGYLSGLVPGQSGDLTGKPQGEPN